MTAIVYTDASRNQWHGISACGFVVVVSGKIIKHEVTLVENIKTPTHAEAFALCEGLQYAFLIEGVKYIDARCDCQVVLSLVDIGTKRKWLEDLLLTIEMIKDAGIVLRLMKVKAHGSNKYNNKVDRSCLSVLRSYLRTGDIKP